MTNFILIALVLISVLQMLVLLVLFFRKHQTTDVESPLKLLGNQNERMEKGLRDEFLRLRDEQGRNSRELREEVGNSMRAQADSGVKQIEILGGLLKNELNRFSETQTRLTSTIEGKLNQIQETNAKKLDEMRQTVDEKLQGALEKRLGDSFKLVSDRLEQVHKGLGEMQSLASGVGDLKRVLTNVKTRGTWGEIQLRAILEQVLLPSQFESNVKIRPNSADNVEFAIKLPGEKDEKPVWLPVDSKFPKEDYERILEAQDNADADALKTARESLARSLKLFAKNIRLLYIDPPHSTDFGILFLPTEGLFAEICQQPGLLDQIQREHRVTVAGPTTMAALLNSLQMGFQTLAIQQRSSEVWEVLGAVKGEFGKFGTLLDHVEKKLDEAKNKISSVRSKTTTISRRLKKVEELPGERSQELLEMTEEVSEITENETEDSVP
ncbi:MAG: DNA recombination protein RmuC [Bdellovibrionaceae bacterium]|nr:DNA recombination protein RmuC [Pseudobdellovibrionaceae bacterium]